MSPNPIPASPKHPAPVIILTGGGSGGHITPLLSLAHALKQENPKCKIVYIGLKGEKVEGLQGRYQVFDQVRFVPAGKFRRYHGQSLVAHLADVRTQALNTRDLFRVVRGLHQAENLIKKIRPDVVFSKGGYVAVPVGLAAKLHNVPIVTHDSDIVPGLANRIVGRWAKVHATGMPADNYGYAPETIRYTGVPVDERIKPVTAALQWSYKTELDLPADAPLLLAAGGGQGSQQINTLMLGIVPKLLAQDAKLRVIHFVGTGLAGKTSLGDIRQQYQKALPGSDYKRLQVLGFTNDFYKYSGAADLIITRAGASAMAEFALQARPCIVIPNDALAGGHQTKNAQRLKAQKLAEVLPGSVSPEQLLKVTLNLLNNPGQRKELAANFSSTARPAAARELAKIILDQARKKQP